MKRREQFTEAQGIATMRDQWIKRYVSERLIAAFEAEFGVGS